MNILSLLQLAKGRPVRLSISREAAKWEGGRIQSWTALQRDATVYRLAPVTCIAGATGCLADQTRSLSELAWPLLLLLPRKHELGGGGRIKFD